jgi:hypothetical protein
MERLKGGELLYTLRKAHYMSTAGEIQLLEGREVVKDITTVEPAFQYGKPGGWSRVAAMAAADI